MLSLLLPASTLLLIPTVPDGEDWPGWRGPNGNGVAEGSPPIEWSEEKNVRWKAAIPGKGKSSPVIWGDRIYVTTAVPTGKKAEATPEPDEPEEPPPARGGRGGGRGGFGGRSAPPEEQHFLVIAYDRKDGSVAWEKEARTGMPPQGTHRDGSHATPTLACDGEHVIASFGSNGIYAYTVDGELAWEKDLGDMEIMNSFGEGSSPVLHGGTVIVNWDHNGESFIVALDKKTGDEKWRKEREGGTSWVTPLVVERDGVAQVIVGTSRTIGYDLESGDELWSYGVGGGRGGVISSPVHYDGVLLVATGNRRGELRAIHVEEAAGDVAPDSLLWTSPGDTPHVPSPVAHDGIVYMLKSNSGLLSAIDAATGDKLYGPVRMEGLANAYASPVVADGRIYFLDRDGMAEVIATGPEFKSLAVNQLDDKFDASPAVSGNELYLRGDSSLYCIAKDAD